MEIKRVSIRNFSRHLYTYINALPLLVYNKRTGKALFVVMPPDGGDFGGNDNIKSKK